MELLRDASKNTIIGVVRLTHTFDIISAEQKVITRTILSGYFELRSHIVFTKVLLLLDFRVNVGNPSLCYGRGYGCKILLSGFRPSARDTRLCLFLACGGSIKVSVEQIK